MRIKIIAGNLIIVTVLGVLAFGLVRYRLEDALASPVANRLSKEQELFERSWRLSTYEFVGLVEKRASASSAVGVFASAGEQRRRENAYRFIRSASSWFDQNREDFGPPDLVVVTDETGTVIARDTDINRMHGQRLESELVTLKKVLQTEESSFELWNKRDERRWFGVGIAPIRNPDGGVLGSLIVGYDLSQRVALVDAELFARDIVFFSGDKVYSSSLSKESTIELEAFISEKLEESDGARFGSGSRRPWKVDLQGNEYFGLTAELPHTDGKELGYAILANHSQQMKLADISYSFLVFIVLMAALVTAYLFFV